MIKSARNLMMTLQSNHIESEVEAKSVPVVHYP